jgi:chitinase
MTSRTVDVTVFGDLLNETDETLRLVLVNPAGASMADGVGVGTIVNDDPSPLSVSDVS